MRADQDIHGAGLRLLKYLLLLSRSAKAADHFSAHRKPRHSLPEGVVMLEGEYRRGCEDGHLFSVLHHFEGSTHGEFRFTVAHVAAEQPVHGLGALKIALDLLERR